MVSRAPPLHPHTKKNNRFSLREKKGLSSAWCIKQMTAPLFLFLNQQLCYSRQNKNFSIILNSSLINFSMAPYIYQKQIAYLLSLNTLVLESIKISWELIVWFSMKIKNSDHGGNPLDIFQIFSRVSKLNFLLYIKTNTVFRLSKNSCIRIDKNIL